MNKKGKTNQVFTTQSMNFNMAFAKLPNHSYRINVDGAEATLICYKDKTATFIIENDKLAFNCKGIVESLRWDTSQDIDTFKVELKLPNNEGFLSVEGVGKLDYISPISQKPY